MAVQCVTTSFLKSRGAQLLVMNDSSGPALVVEAQAAVLAVCKDSSRSHNVLLRRIFNFSRCRIFIYLIAFHRFIVNRKIL